MGYVAAHYTESMEICENKTNTDEQRLRALDRLKLIEDFLNYLDDYKEEQDDRE
ncbi:hypothetical protein [Campylobacter sp. RM16192]|uniref:hypothetical protein n=1 Tax=Campylobacter sp. RM16192 TaxID=1660080 RepID=UPI001451BF23|nr:hypothetical protein [Campylobacter sp. RM16192]QCD52810.1 hypothetical protein CDOMC_1203 [Campylobacter sp. RM16192]